jgi:MinD superfamily P-loop ATPase
MRVSDTYAIPCFRRDCPGTLRETNRRAIPAKVGTSYVEIKLRCDGCGLVALVYPQRNIEEEKR